MITPTLTADLAKLALFMEAIAEIKNVPMAKVIRNASRDFVKTAYFGTPVARATRTNFLLVPGAAQNTVATKNGPAHWVHKKKSKTASKWNPPFPVRKSYAKSTWIPIMRALGMNSGSTKFGNSQNWANYSVSGSPQQLQATILNSLGYIGKLDRRADFARRGIAAASAKIENELIRIATSAKARL
jgi:hypothetical protein